MAMRPIKVVDTLAEVIEVDVILIIGSPLAVEGDLVLG
jgi:hypothetical protein